MTFEILNAFPKNGFIYVTLPYWNTATKEHHFPTTTPPIVLNCIENNNPLICSYEATTRILSVTNPTARKAKDEISFSVSSFTNPYNGAPKSGFTIETKDSNGCSIESISTLTLQTNTMATMKTEPVFSRVDTVKTVQELSTMNITITNTFPIDASCKLVLTFPSDMPITSDLKSYTSMSGIFYTGTVSTAGVGTTSTSLTILGCTTSIAASVSSSMKLL